MSTEDRASRREVLAFIALQDLPMPETVSFYRTGSVSLTLETVTQGLTWCQLLDADAKPYTNTDGRLYLGARGATWHGWYVQINASDELSLPVDPPLGEDTASALRELAGGDQ